MDSDTKVKNGYLHSCFTTIPSPPSLNALKLSQSALEGQTNNVQRSSDWARPFKRFYSSFLHKLGKVPPRFLNLFVVYPLLTLGVWGAIWSIFGKDQAFPGGSLFSLFVLIITAVILSNEKNMSSFKKFRLGLLSFWCFYRQNCTYPEMCTSLWNACGRAAPGKRSTLVSCETLVN